MANSAKQKKALAALRADPHLRREPGHGLYAAGETVRVKGNRGKFLIIQTVTNERTGDVWVDVTRPAGHRDQRIRSFSPEMIR